MQPVPARPTARAVLPLVPGWPQRPARRPLPDATAVRLLPVPDSAPPYDEGPGRQEGNSGPACREPRRPGPGSAGGPREASGTGETSRNNGASGASGWPSQFAQVLAETLAGSRPQGQIAAWTTDQARKRIRQLGPMLSGQAAGAAPRVRRIVTSRPALGVVEMTVIVGCGPRTRALAVRLERAAPLPPTPDDDTRADDTGPATWVCTAVESA
jgi:hypothetical protein